MLAGGTSPFFFFAGVPAGGFRSLRGGMAGESEVRVAAGAAGGNFYFTVCCLLQLLTSSQETPNFWLVQLASKERLCEIIVRM